MSEEGKVGEKLAPFNPTSIEVVKLSIELLNLNGNDVIYDLGCGDARFLVEACRCFPSIRGIGVEYDVEIYNRAVALVQSNQLTNQITILHDNVLNIDFSNATVLFIYLVPDGIKKLKTKLVEALDRGVRIVTYVFSIPELVPTKVEVFKGATKIYLYTKQ